MPVPTEPQRVDFLINGITSSDNTIQATIGLIWANANNIRSNFELAASALIEVDPYKRSQRAVERFRIANVSSLNFSAGRATTGVDLRWHPRKDFVKLP